MCFAYVSKEHQVPQATFQTRIVKLIRMIKIGCPKKVTSEFCHNTQNSESRMKKHKFQEMGK